MAQSKVREFSHENGGSVRYVNVYQMVETPLTPIKPRFSYDFPMVFRLNNHFPLVFPLFLWFSYGFPMVFLLKCTYKGMMRTFLVAGEQVTSIVEKSSGFFRTKLLVADHQLLMPLTNDATYVYLYVYICIFILYIYIYTHSFKSFCEGFYCSSVHIYRIILSA